MFWMLLIVALLVLLALFVSLSVFGRNLKLFSSTAIQKNNHPYWMRLFLYFAIGFVWVFAKIHFPGFETMVTYGFDNKLGIVLRATYWKCRIKKLGKDVIIDVGAKATSWHFVSIGDNSWIDHNVILETGVIDKAKYMVYVKKTSPLVSEGELKIEKGCHISKNAVMQSCGGVFIGDFTDTVNDWLLPGTSTVQTIREGGATIFQLDPKGQTVLGYKDHLVMCSNTFVNFTIKTSPLEEQG
jgi:hypothetical protein